MTDFLATSIAKRGGLRPLDGDARKPDLNKSSQEKFDQLMLSGHDSESLIRKYECKFKSTEKLLVVTIDDLDSPNLNSLSELINHTQIPVTLFPHKEANLKILKELQILPNTKLGWHGYDRGKLDLKPLPSTDKSVIAWSYGFDGEGRKKRLGKETIGRGVACRANKFGEFDQHQLSSCSLHDKFNKKEKKALKNARTDVLENGGVFAVHLHHSGGLDYLKETIKKFKQSGGRLVFIDELKGCGK